MDGTCTWYYNGSKYNTECGHNYHLSDPPLDQPTTDIYATCQECPWCGGMIDFLEEERTDTFDEDSEDADFYEDELY